MSVSAVSVVVRTTDHDAAIQRYKRLLGPPENEFTVPGRGLTITIFHGLSVVSARADVLAPVRALRAAVFVESPPVARTELAASGWTTEGSLGAGSSLLARDPDGMLAEFVEIPATGT